MIYLSKHLVDALEKNVSSSVGTFYNGWSGCLMLGIISTVSLFPLLISSCNACSASCILVVCH